MPDAAGGAASTGAGLGGAAAGGCLAGAAAGDCLAGAEGVGFGGAVDGGCFEGADGGGCLKGAKGGCLAGGSAAGASAGLPGAGRRARGDLIGSCCGELGAELSSEPAGLETGEGGGLLGGIVALEISPEEVARTGASGLSITGGLDLSGRTI